MKRFYISVAISLCIVLFCATTLYQFGTAASYMIDELSEIEQKIFSENLDQAKDISGNLLKYWSQQEKQMILSLRHDYIEQISIRLAKVKKMLEIHSEIDDVLEEIEELRNIIVHIWHVEAPWIRQYVHL